MNKKLLGLFLLIGAVSTAYPLGDPVYEPGGEGEEGGEYGKKPEPVAPGLPVLKPGGEGKPTPPETPVAPAGGEAPAQKGGGVTVPQLGPQGPEEGGAIPVAEKASIAETLRAIDQALANLPKLSGPTVESGFRQSAADAAALVTSDDLTRIAEQKPEALTSIVNGIRASSSPSETGTAVAVLLNKGSTALESASGDAAPRIAEFQIGLLGLLSPRVLGSMAESAFTSLLTTIRDAIATIGRVSSGLIDRIRQSLAVAMTPGLNEAAQYFGLRWQTSSEGAFKNEYDRRLAVLEVGRSNATMPGVANGYDDSIANLKANYNMIATARGFDKVA